MTRQEAIEYHENEASAEQHFIDHALAHPRNYELGGNNTLIGYIEKHQKSLEASEWAVKALKSMYEPSESASCGF